MFLEKAYSGKNRWALYILTLLIVFIAIQLAGIPFAVYALMAKGINAAEAGNMLALAGTNTGLPLMLLSYVGGFFALLLCVKYIQQKKYTDIITGRSRIDYKRILFGAGIWAVLMIVTFVFQIMTSDTSSIVLQFDPLNFTILVITALVFLPFQTSFEELVFRGYLMQGSVLLFKYRWVAWLLTSIIFGALHAANPEVEKFGLLVAMPQYILMGLILGYVAIKDDGLELALGLHMANNILAAVTVTSDASALQTHALFIDLAPSASHTDTLIMLISGLIFIVVCNRKYHFGSKINLWAKVEKPIEIEPTEELS